MNIGITGTTSGIGKALKNYYNPVVEFNRKDGNIEDVNSVYNKLKNCDIFINNAYHEQSQILLLDHFYKSWRDNDKKIITIGSSVCSYAPSGTGYEQYVENKRKLRELHMNIVSLKNSCKSYLINPGVTDTPMVSSRRGKKLSTNDVVSIINFVITHRVYIPEIYFYAK